MTPTIHKWTSREPKGPKCDEVPKAEKSLTLKRFDISVFDQVKTGLDKLRKSTDAESRSDLSKSPYRNTNVLRSARMKARLYAYEK